MPSVLSVCRDEEATPLGVPLFNVDDLQCGHLIRPTAQCQKAYWVLTGHLSSSVEQLQPNKGVFKTFGLLFVHPMLANLLQQKLQTQWMLFFVHHCTTDAMCTAKLINAGVSGRKIDEELHC